MDGTRVDGTLVDGTRVDGTLADGILDRLLRQAYLFDDPRAYEAGVRDAVAALDQHARELATATPPPRHRAA